ncbi:hypothetical protein N7495_001442 [Penicillium taxi]|uniref:uncharacterized protein n=1 Tax=Penicillium taxi TaxID=168475 RepID=UPI002544D3B5|nr:uncharacterized protein N7495_001442 [Penicillium taxi]KAJ5908760.1 hypothetical protein N7495_001442 [Penicillium taxi]
MNLRLTWRHSSERERRNTAALMKTRNPETPLEERPKIQQKIHPNPPGLFIQDRPSHTTKISQSFSTTLLHDSGIDSGHGQRLRWTALPTKSDSSDDADAKVKVNTRATVSGPRVKHLVYLPARLIDMTDAQPSEETFNEQEIIHILKRSEKSLARLFFF